MFNLNTFPLSQMGVLPYTGGKDVKMLQMKLMKKHQKEFIERGKWTNLPPELNHDLIERIMFYRFKGAFFKFNEKFWFLPFHLNGTIDSYGRYKEITPVLFTGQFENGKEKDIPFLPESITNESIPVAYGLGYELTDPAIILTDTSLDISQDIIPEYLSIAPIIEQLGEILVLISMDLISSAKVFTIVAKDAGQKMAIEKEFENFDARIMSGKRVIVVTGDDATKELQELQGAGESKDSARYFQSYQSIDNLRKSLMEMENGGQFLKQEHQTDQETSASGSQEVAKNFVRMRQEFAELVNAYYGLGIAYEAEEPEDKAIMEPEGSQTKELRGDK